MYVTRRNDDCDHYGSGVVAETAAYAVILKFYFVLNTGRRIVSPNIIGFISFNLCYMT